MALVIISLVVFVGFICVWAYLRPDRFEFSPWVSFLMIALGLPTHLYWYRVRPMWIQFKCLIGLHVWAYRVRKGVASWRCHSCGQTKGRILVFRDPP